jgi:alanine racemase
VYSPDEARDIAAAGLVCPILILMPVDQLDRTDMLYRAAVNGRLHLTVHSPAQLDAIEALGRKFGTALPVHIELDSGMSRGGMNIDDTVDTINGFVNRRYVKLVGLFTHAASAASDADFTAQQNALLDEVIDRLDAPLGDAVTVHFANTYSALRDRRFHRDMLRIGLGLYGYGGEAADDSFTAGVAPLQPIVRWMSAIVHTRQAPAGRPVGYGSTWTTPRDTRLGLVPVGYGEGYPLLLANNAVVRVGARRHLAPVRGAVNMDQLIIDLTDAPDTGIGSAVEIYAADPAAPNALHALAGAAQSSCYELLCRLSSRITRRYVTPVPGRSKPGHVVTR